MLKNTRDVFFARPKAPYERGTKQNQHKLICRFIPKSKGFVEISTKTIRRIQQWINNIPPRILGEQTVEETFLKELQSPST